MKVFRRFFQFIFIFLFAIVLIAMISGGSSYLGRMWFPRDPSMSSYISMGMLILLACFTAALNSKE
jgi:hypothetical protein